MVSFFLCPLKIGTIFTYKLSDGTEEIYQYDCNNNLIHYKSKDYEYWKECDIRGNTIFFKDSNGYEECNYYDRNDNLILFINTMNNKADRLMYVIHESVFLCNRKLR